MQTVPDSHFRPSSELRRYEALLQMADLLVRHRDLGELFNELAAHLREITAFESVAISLHNPGRNDVVLHYDLDDPRHSPVEMQVDGSISGWVWQNQQPLNIDDVETEVRFPECVALLRRNKLRSCCVLPLTTAQRRVGALGLGGSRPNVSSEMDVRLLQRVAEMTALAVENAQIRDALHLEKERLRTLLEVNAALSSSLELQKLFPAVSTLMRNVVNQDFASICIYDESNKALSVYALDFPALRPQMSPGSLLPLQGTAPGAAFLGQTTKLFNRQELEAFDQACTNELLTLGAQSGCCITLITSRGPVGVLNLASRDPYAFQHDLEVLQQFATQIAVALDNSRAYNEIATLKDRLTEEKHLLQGEIRSLLDFEEIIGDSPALGRVLEKVRTVSPSDATVLILGETGTGKELIARAIHRMSRRNEASFIKLNCAAIPTGLLESELFGHEKGAFTGAVSQKIGRLELADRGTLFLDEVGDIPLELQPKLLRVLQDQEFERLGSTRTIKVNIRLIAATNRDLPSSMAEGQFRSDLYYRLNVFPVRMPSLRERKHDIPLLVNYFVQKLSHRMNKQIDSVPAEIMDALVGWDWPGNVRELENFIERSVILTAGSVLNVPLAELAPDPGTSRQGTLQSLEREHIVRMLRETGGVVAGISGAAARLGMKRTTLQSMIHRMGISRKEYGS